MFALSFVLPCTYFLYLYFLNQISDWDITHRKQRYRVFGVTLIGLLLSLLYIHLHSTPAIFTEFAKLLLLAIVLVLLNFKVKVSIHVALVTVLALILTGYFSKNVPHFGASPWVFALVPLVAVSRVALKKHTVPQVLLGALIPVVFYLANNFLP